MNGRKHKKKDNNEPGKSAAEAEKSTTPVSIAMITYNSERFLRPQIDTILSNMREGDELIISDDGSTDHTIDIIQSYIATDSRISLIHNNSHGINENYMNAIMNCHNDIIFLSDDDNVWLENKINTVLNVFLNNSKCLLVQHNCRIVDHELNDIGGTFFDAYKSKPGLIRNWIRSTYGGSLIAIRRSLLQYIFPLPKNMPTFYDDWFGLMAEKHGKTIFIEDVLSLWRRHSGSNSTGFKAEGKGTTKGKFSSWIKRNLERIKVRTIKLDWLLFR